MCGICGYFDQSGKPADRELLERMSRAIGHRGPDGSGDLVDRNVALGHRRLSIIDLEGGKQPLTNEDGTLHVVFNGEIYNYIELTAELVGLGHTFRTHSDTETIVHAFEQWGPDCVRRFNGMFAFAIWNTTSRQLFLARDHLGIKPLYYTQIGTRILFGSEIKALLQDSSCRREVDHKSLIDLFTFRYVPSPRTLFRGIQKLPPAHWMTISEKETRIERFWHSRPPLSPLKKSEGEFVEEYQHLVQDAIRLQLRSDVPLGLFLSSGIDSAALLAIMKQLTATSVKTFTIGFESGDQTNETDDARDLAAMFASDHHELIVTADDYMEYYERYMWDIEEPLGNETAAAFYFVSKIASKHVKVALSGQGADEPWAGYHRHLAAKLSSVLQNVPGSHQLLQTMARCFPSNERITRAAASLGERDILTRLTKIYSFFDVGMKDALFQPWLKAETPDYQLGSKTALQWLHRDVEDRDILTQILYIDTRSNLPDDLLMVGDKTSMANSLEARVPYLDYRLVEFVEALPPHLRLRYTRGKYLHKQALRKWLPDTVVHRKKKGFANPIEHWVRTKMRAYVEELLFSGDSATNRYFDARYVRWMLEADRNGTHQFRRHIYLILSFELWHRRFIARAP